MNALQSMTWGDLGQLFDGPHATPKRMSEGPYFLNISSLIAGRLDLDQSDHVSEEDFAKWTKRVTPRPGDLLFSYETRLGEAALMPDNLHACLGRRMALLRPNLEIVDPRFLLYFYLSPTFQRTIQKHTIHGATVPRILLSTMGSWEVELPRLTEQQAIAEVLGALDDKIAANSKLVETASQLAHSTFRSARALESVKLSDTARFVNGKAFTKDASGTGRVVIRIAELNSGIGGSTVFNDLDVEDDYLAREGDILFAWSGSLTLHRWFRPEGIVNQHIFKVIPNDDYPKWLVYELIQHKLEEFKAIASDKATTMGHIQRKHLDELVAVPDELTVHGLDAIMSPLWDRMLSAEIESLRLNETRDALLPQLMSGKLRVKDAEKVVAAAV